MMGMQAYRHGRMKENGDEITMLEIGNWLMVLCAAFYLAWWRITFHPPAPAGTPIGKICLLLAFVTGLAGLSLAVISMNSVSGEKAKTGIPGIAIVIGGEITYVVLLALSSRLFHRQVTSELLIIVIWTVLELCALNSWYRHGKLFQFSSIILAGLVIVVAAASLICYLQYYRISYEKGYLIGSVPLLLTAIIMVVINLVVLFEGYAVRGQIMDGDTITYLMYFELNEPEEG